MSIERRTVFLLLAAAVVLAAANAIPLRIPFVGEQEADGYMIKTGWPCSFREETRHRVFWESNDVWIDAIAAGAVLAALAWGSEWSMRRGVSFARYVSLVVAIACVVGVNLHEHTTAAATTRGWPVPAIINGPFGIHHNRIEPLGALIDGLTAGAIVTAWTWALSRSGAEARLRRWIG